MTKSGYRNPLISLGNIVKNLSTFLYMYACTIYVCLVLAARERENEKAKKERKKVRACGTVYMYIVAARIGLMCNGGYF